MLVQFYTKILKSRFGTFDLQSDNLVHNRIYTN